MSKKNPDTSAADQETALAQEQNAQTQQEIAEKRNELDQMELAMLHSQGGLQFDTGVPASFPPPATPSKPKYPNFPVIPEQ
jgi:hypothetical protein